MPRMSGRPGTRSCLAWLAPLTLATLVALPACSARDGGSAISDVAAALTASHEEAERWADETLARLTLEQKVGQLITEQMRGEYVADDDAMFQYWRTLVRDYGVGGFVVYGGTPHDTADLLNRLQAESDVPLLMSADFEGGPGQQFAGASEFPANMALSAIGSEDLAYEVGRVGATEGRAIGIHLTYSPVVDVQTQPDNPVLGVRSFGPDLDLLGRLASAYIRGYQDHGMLATAKHYPGRGDVELVPGTEFTVNHKPADEVEQTDFLAFQHAIDAGVTFIMTEHISVPSVTDGSELPASVEPALSTAWVRGRLGFEGVLTTDDLWYDKVVDRFGAEQVGVMAIQAGHDALLKPLDAIGTIGAVVEAVEAGDIPRAQIDDSARRILYCKARLNLHQNRFVDPGRIDQLVGTAEHTALVHEIANRSLTLVENDGFFPTTADALGRVVHVSIQKTEHLQAARDVSAHLAESLPVAQTFAVRPNVDPAVRAEAVAAARQADTVVVSLFHPRTVYVDHGPLRPDDAELVRALIATKPGRTVVMSYGNPYLAGDVRGAAAFVVGYGEGGFYGNQVVYGDAFARLLRGEIDAAGTLPVTLPDN
ncbi:MAG: hypothetical protein CL471_16630 [Acidobacteria bacterium]|nr:hypothetical protein [Acidobacteriota bacterium]